MARTKQTTRKKTGVKTIRKSSASKSSSHKSHTEESKSEREDVDYNKMTVSDLKKLLQERGINWKQLPKSGKSTHVKKDFVDALLEEKSSVKSSPKKELIKSVKKSPHKDTSEPHLPYDVIKYLLKLSDDYSTIMKMCTSSKELLKHCDFKFWQLLINKKIGEKARKCLSIKDCQSLMADYDILTKIIQEMSYIKNDASFEGILSLEFKVKNKVKYIKVYGDDFFDKIDGNKMTIKEIVNLILSLDKKIIDEMEFIIVPPESDYFSYFYIYKDIKASYFKASSRNEFIGTQKKPFFIWI